MVEVVKPGDEDIDDGTTCSFHPYRSSHGGICPLCLQEKLRKLLSSSSSSSSSTVPVHVSSPSSSFRSDLVTTATVASTKFPSENPNNRSSLPFLLGNNKKTKSEVDFRRSMSVTAPARYGAEDHVRKNRSWLRSFLYLSSSKSKKTDQSSKQSSKIASEKQMEKWPESSPVRDAGDGAPAADSKVSRSRSVGCGSRSFSGEERVKCGGIFGGFMIHTAASSSYWVASSGDDTAGKISPAMVGRRKKKGGEKNSSSEMDAVPSLFAVRM